MRMKNKKKAQAWFAAFGIGIIAMIAVFVCLPAIKNVVIDARGEANGMNCSDPSLSTGSKATCILIDWAGFYWAIVGLAGGFAYFFGKRIISNYQQ